MKKNTKFNLIASISVGSFLKEITMNNFKILITTFALLAFVGNQQLFAQTCTDGAVFDLDENEFPQTCISSNGAEGTPATATFDHDFATNTGGVYSGGADGTNDVTVTMSATCSFPNGTNGTTHVAACVGPGGLSVSQAAGPNNLGGGASDFGGSTVDDAPCANCWTEVCYDFINGFTSNASGFDVDWSSLNGSTEGYEAAFGWIEGIDNTGAPFSPGISAAGLAGYCPAQALTMTASEFLTGTAPGGALPAGVFGADAITGDGVATACPTEEPGSSSGPFSSPSTGMGSGAIPANWGLNPDDEVTRFCIVYLMSNSNADDCDGDGATAVNTSPSGSLSTVDFCVPNPVCEVLATIANPVVCSGSDLVIDVDATAVTGAAPRGVMLFCGGAGNGDASGTIAPGTTGQITLNNYEQFSGLTTICELVVVEDVNADPLMLDAACAAAPISFTFLELLDASFTQTCNADGSADVTVTVIGGGLPALDGGATMYTLGGTNGDGSQVAAGGTYTFTIADGAWDVEISDDNGCTFLVAGVWIPPTMTLNACFEKMCEVNAACPADACVSVGCITGAITPLLGGFTITYNANGDGFPQEQSFTIFNSAGAPVGSGAGDYTTPINVTGLDPADTYTIEFYDSFGDGMDCTGVGTFEVADFAGGNILPATPFDCGGTVVTCSGSGGCTFMGPYPLGSPIASIAPIGTIAGPGVTDNGDNTADFDKCAAGPGVHTITFDYTDSRGCILSESLDITICAAPADPVAMDVTVCEGEDLTITADVVSNFYAAAPTDPTVGILATGTTYTPTAAGSYFLVAANTDAATGTTCYSCAVEVVVTILAAGVPPTPAADVIACEADPAGATLTAACAPCSDGSAVTVSWYADATSTTVIGTAADLVIPATTVGTFTNYASCTCNGCESPRTAYTAIIEVNPIANLACPTAPLCVDGAAFDLAPTDTGVGSTATGAPAGTGVAGNMFDPAVAGAGTHTVTYTLTSANGCTSTATCEILVVESVAPVVSDAVIVCQTNPDMTAMELTATCAPCPAALDGSTVDPTITVYAADGTVLDSGTGTSFTYNPGLDNTLPQTQDYSFTCDCWGCEGPSAASSITVNANPDKVISDITHVTCPNDADGSVTISTTNSGPAGDNDPTTSADVITATVFATGGSPATGTGQILSAGATTFTLGAGVYDVQTTDAFGCVSEVMTFEIFAAPVYEPTCTVWPEICKDDDNGAIRFATDYVVAGPARTLTISLELDGAVLQSAAYTAGDEMTYTDLADGLYTIRVVDNLGCEYTENKNIEPGFDKLPPVTTGVTICQFDGDATGTVADLTATGVCDGVGEIRWFADAASTTLLGTGNAFNPVTDGGVDPTIPGMTVFWAECGCDRCAVDTNGTNPSGCSECVSVRVPAAFMVGQNPQIDLDAVTNETCPGANDGTVYIDGHDGIVDLIYGVFDAVSDAPIATSPSTSTFYQFTGLAPGSYYVTFVDAAGVPLDFECNDVAFFTISTAADGMIDSMVSTDLTCNGSDDGTITLTASGDVGFVAEYSVNGGPWQTSATWTDLPAGSYTITVRNQNAIDCTFELPAIIITEPEPLQTGTGNDLSICLGQDSAPLTAAIEPCSGCSDPCGLCAPADTLVTQTFTETFTVDWAFSDPFAYAIYTYNVPDVPFPCASNVTGISMVLDTIIGNSADWVFATTEAGVSFGTGSAWIGQDFMALDPIITFGDGTTLSGFGPDEMPYQPGDNFIFGITSLTDGASGTATWTISYTYEVPDVSNTPPAIDPVVTWWNSPAFGTEVTSFDTDGIDEIFDPIAAGMVNPNIPGTYTYYAQANCDGCLSGRVPVVLTVLEELPAPAIEGPAFVCPGGTATYSVPDDGLTYTWSVDGTPIATGASIDLIFDGTTGSIEISIAANDADGCMNSSSLIVTQQIDNAMFCNPSKNASVGTDCSFEVTPFTMVKNPLYDESSYAVTLITNDATGEVVYNAAEGTGSTTLVLEVDPAADNCTEHYTVTVEHLCSGNRCSGTLNLEDKTPPTIACPSPMMDNVITSFAGTLSADDPTYDRATLSDESDVSTCSVSGVGIGVSYDTYTFMVDADDTFVFAGTFLPSAGDPNNGDQNGSIYAGSFDPLNPCDNLVAYDDDEVDGVINDPMLTADLQAGVTYILVSTSFSPGDFGDYSWAISSAAGAVAFTPIEVTYFCTQIDEIYTPTETTIDLDSTVLMTGNPTVSDNCSNFFVTYSDEMVGTDCDISILRTFTVTDACGNTSSCNQTLNFTNPDLDLVNFPMSFDVECDGTGVTQVHPDSLGEDYDYPYFGDDPITGDLNNGLCNINLTWTDQVLEQCGSSYKVLREWTVLDWCAVEAGEEETYVQGAQIIFVTDTTGPEIACVTQQVYAADPFECEAVVTIPGISYVDACSGIGAAIDNNGFPRDQATGNNSQNGDVDNDRVWYTNGDEAVDLQGFTISVTVDGAPYTLFDNNGSTNWQGSPLPTDSNGDRILVDVTNGKPFEAQMGDQIRLIGAGDHTIVYSVTDDCGNVSTCTSIITIEDQSAPNPICDENTVAVLGGDGTATICWETFDDGSFDNCDDVIVRVKRMDDPLAEFTECVDFDCADLQYDDACPANVNGVTQVRMRVYHAGDAGLLSYEDNENPGILWNECMINVEVQDKQAPAIICPPDKFLECMDDYTLIDNVTDNEEDGPEVYQGGVLIGYYNGPIIDNCDNHVIELSEVGSVDGCGEGDIYRTYTITDLTTCASHSCVQRINVSKTYDQHFLDGVVSCDLFDNNIISPTADGGDRDRLNWPADRNINCSADSGDESTHPDNTGRPDYAGTEEDDCHNLLQGYEDKFHYDDPNNCYRILRTWSVYDWCQYDPNSGSCQGVWTHVQVINVNDNTAPVITCGDDITAEANSAGCATADGCSGTIALPIEAVDGCGGDVTFSYEIDAFWNGSDFTADITGDGLADGEYPQGLHRVRYTATDACGNTASCMYNFEIIDVKAPTPICIALNSVTMDESGSLEMWASDFESGSSCDNCTLYENLQWRIRKANDPTPLPEPLTADDLPTGVTFTCADGEIGGNEVYIYLFDEAGNYDFCLTGINILPGNDDCLGGGPEMLSIAGHVETEDTDMVENVNIDISGMNSSIFNTGSNGLFNFLNAAAPGGNYVVTPEKDIDFLNGVTTFDLVLISQHILGVQTLDSPYKIIAADANKSNTVTTLDLVKLQRLILNIDNDLAPNTSWRFVDMDHTFGNEANPFDTTYPAFPEVISLNNMTSDEMDADFVGVKIGDVNGSAIPNMVLGSTTRNAEGNLTLVANEMMASRGEAFTVDFTADNFDNVLGYQFTLDFDATSMDMVEIIPGTLKGLTTDNFGLSMLNDGIITTSWHNAEKVSVKSTEVLFSIEFKAISDLKLSDVISISSEVTRAEAYNGNADLLDVDLGINTENGVVTNAVFELLQNSPNPFKGETLIGFSLPKATPATLSIMDVSGKLLKTIEGDFVKGYNEVKLNSSQFEGAGVLYYQLDTPTDTATKKMILID